MTISVPYRYDLDLGRAYNQVMATAGEDEWVLIKDYDVLFLLPETIKHIYEYPKHYPDAAVFTCLTNRIHSLNAQQLLNGKISEERNIEQHINLAKRQEKYLYEVKEWERDISGFLMLVSKKTWNEIKFTENGKALGIDTQFSVDLRNAGKKVYIMQGIYCFHIYRMLNGVADKKHLQKT